MRRAAGAPPVSARDAMSATRPHLSASDLDRPIVMVGMMGAGKSAIGRRLAHRLGVPFVDADAEIESAAGTTIADIFEKHGEAAFRDGERRVIARLLEGPIGVLATGGGAFMDAETRARRGAAAMNDGKDAGYRSEERRVGKEC